MWFLDLVGYTRLIEEHGAALGMVEEGPGAGLSPAHVGVAAGPVVQGGD